MLESRINDIAEQLVHELKNEFEQQGHNASGKGLASIQHKTIIKGGNVHIQVTGIDYLNFVNTGRNIGKMPPVDAILEWVRIKNIAQGDEAERAAWAIAKAIKREGIPTENAYKFSKNGRRKGFVEIVKMAQLEPLKQQIRRAILDAYREELINKITDGVKSSVTA